MVCSTNYISQCKKGKFSEEFSMSSQHTHMFAFKQNYDPWTLADLWALTSIFSEIAKIKVLGYQNNHTDRSTCKMKSSLRLLAKCDCLFKNFEKKKCFSAKYGKCENFGSKQVEMAYFFWIQAQSLEFSKYVTAQC